MSYNFRSIGSGEHFEPVTHVVNIGIIKGSWFQMGSQYGHRLAYDIRRNTDLEWEENLVKFNNNPSLLKNALAGYREQLELFSPQTVDFIKGMAAGAADQMEKSAFSGQGSGYERIFNLNASLALLSPGPHASTAQQKTDDCNSFWVGGEGTTDSRAIVTFHSQGGKMGWANHARKVLFVAVPDDKNARIVWNFASAGAITWGGIMFNDAGVFHALHTADNQEHPDAKAVGVEPNLGRFHAVFHAKSAREAADIMIYGTPEYRRSTGRKKLLGTRGVDLLFADAETCIMLELTASRHAKRFPGESGEPGNFINQSNHLHQNFSYDENDTLTDVPMTRYAPGVPGESSYHRFWSPYWSISKVYGAIDREMVMRKLTSSHEIYNAAGEMLPYTKGHTFCSHEYDEARDNPGGSHAVAVAVPETLEIYQLQYWPCRFTTSGWNYFDLKEYRMLRSR